MSSTPVSRPFVRERVELVLMLGDALVMTERRQIADLATVAQLPTIYSFREYPVAGGLMSYGVTVICVKAIGVRPRLWTRS
jgi:putative tryptophan/tyrosine transport system substrate-binding protein